MGHHDDKRPDERVVDYIYGELGAAEAARFEAEMGKDPALAAEVRELQAVANLAADGAERIPDPPEAAVAEAMAAAQARCDQVRRGELGFWDRIAGWLLTPQLAGALTLALVISVGVYTLQTGVFDRDKTDEPSVKHEMAPVGPVGEGEESQAAKADKAGVKKADTKAISQEGRRGATETRGEQAPPPEEPTPDPRRERALVRSGANVTEQPPAMDWATEKEPAPDQAPPQPAESAAADQDNGDADRWEDEGVERAKAAPRDRGLDSLVDLVTPGDLAAAQDLNEAEDPPAKELDLNRDARTGVAEFRAKVDGDAGNFVEKSLKKPEAPVAGKTSAYKNEKKKKKAGTLSSVTKKAISRKVVPKTKDKAAPAAKLSTKDRAQPSKPIELLKETGADAPAPATEGKARQLDQAKRVETVTSPKITRSILDGIVVPPSAEPAREKQEEVTVTANASLADQTVSYTERTGGDDDYLGATAGSGGAPSSGEFGDAGLDEDAEPGYLVRPDAAEAPGVMVTKRERRSETKKKQRSMKSVSTQLPAPAVVSLDSQDTEDLAQLRYESERAEVEEPAQVEEEKVAMDSEVDTDEAVTATVVAGAKQPEASKEDAPAGPSGEAAACAALARAIEEAEEAEDWALAEKLSQQMIARGCVSGADLDTFEEQEVRYRQKALEADLSAPAVGEEAPAAEKAAEPAEAVEKPNKME